MQTTFLEIPFNRPTRTGREELTIQQALDGPLSAGGPLTQTCQDYLYWLIDAKCLLTTSCTRALEMASILLDLGPADEVILPAFTYPSCATSFMRTGAQPVFADIDSRDLNIDLTSVAQRITKHTKAIMAVHYAGAPYNKAI